MESINPTTGESVGHYEDHSPAQVQAKIADAQAAFEKLRRTSFNDRATKLHLLADQLRRMSAENATLMVEEMGKPIAQAETELEKCARVCDFYSEHAEHMLASRPAETDASISYVRFDPLGPVLAIMPWNFPFWQVFRFAAPAIMAGNTALLKHAANVSGCAVAIERAFREAGFPPGVLTTLLIPSDRVADVVRDSRIRAVTLTGSEAAGRAVAEQAGRSLRKCVLELGGSDPFIVLNDADLPLAAKQAARSRTINNGQSCIAAKRFLVESRVAERFQSLFVEEMERLNVGDPKNRTTDIGPLARPDLRDTLHKQVRSSVQAGARTVTGGEIPAGPGCYYPPTVLVDVAPGMPAFDEELFGPVAAVTRVKSADEAVALANQSRFGLGASIWTTDLDRAQALAADIESGAVFVNEIVMSDPRVPFGGVKDSGYGRELGEFGIREFVNTKTVWVA